MQSAPQREGFLCPLCERSEARRDSENKIQGQGKSSAQHRRGCRALPGSYEFCATSVSSCFCSAPTSCKLVAAPIKPTRRCFSSRS